MNRRGFLRGLAAVAACPVCAGLASRAHAAGSEAHWDYEGHGGPQHWGQLDRSYAACSSGSQQSPVDLNDPIPAMVGDIDLRWNPVPIDIVNNGHTLQVDTPSGGGMSFDGRQWRLIQFHFHHPSEHTVDGHTRAMEVHFVHKASEGDLAVVGVFIEPGAENPVLAPLWSVMPKQAGARVRRPETVAPAGLLPLRPVTYRYAGSLTTPPCSEVVSWIVFQDWVEASPEQIAAFADLFPMNARPTQPLHRRKLLLDFF